MSKLPSKRTMVDAFRRKDPAFDGTFFVGVKTTGVFCRPVCRAKPALPQNLEFFGTADEAVRQGYRACRLCRPLEQVRRPPAAAQRLIELMENGPSSPLREAELRAMGIHPGTARRQFRAHFDMTFADFQRARRLGAALAEVRTGRSVTHAQVGCGYSSASGFRDAVRRLTGGAARAATSVEQLVSAQIDTPLGAMLAVARDSGVVLLEFADRDRVEASLCRVRRACGTRVADAVVVPGTHPHLRELARQLRAYFAGTLRQFTVPIDPCGTSFQRRAWQYLSTIPYGQTRTYGQQAAAIGRATAVRAVGRANGLNPLCIIVPCHRVIGAGGELTGYGGGLARKRWLLAHEAAHRAGAIER